MHSFYIASNLFPKLPIAPDIYQSETKYAELEQLLADQLWHAANRETFVILSATCGLTSDCTVKIGNLSCYDLYILDSLWLNSSHGRFGFSVQQRIWQQLCPDAIEVHDAQQPQWVEFCNRLNWNGEAPLHAPAGHFPSRVAVRQRPPQASPEVFTRLYSSLGARRSL